MGYRRKAARMNKGTLPVKKIKKEPDQNKQNKGRMEEVYEKAARLFKLKGYLATSVNDIADEMQIQKASLYYYIKDKETLLFQILEKTMDDMLKNVKEIPSLALPPEEKLAFAIREHIVHAVHYLNEFSVLLHDTQHLRKDLRNRIFEKRREYEDIFLEIVNEGIFQKVFVAQDPKILVFMILGSGNWLYQWFSKKGPKPPEEIADIFCAVFLKGLLMK
jgi:TetR/AcrR family transcriptional regulator, cholesterol catabolism regulator